MSMFDKILECAQVGAISLKASKKEFLEIICDERFYSGKISNDYSSGYLLGVHIECFEYIDWDEENIKAINRIQELLKDRGIIRIIKKIRKFLRS